MKRQNLALLLVGAMCLASAVQATAGETSKNILTVADYLELEGVGDPQISPDGSKILFTREWIDRIRRNPLFRALRVDKLAWCTSFFEAIGLGHVPDAQALAEREFALVRLIESAKNVQQGAFPRPGNADDGQ